MQRCLLAALATLGLAACQTADPAAQRAEIRNAVESQLYEYTYALDSGDMDWLKRLFEHAVMRVDGTDAEYVGPDAIAQTNIDFNIYYDAQGEAGRYRPNTTPRTRHVTTNVIVEVSDDLTSATSRSSVIVFQFAPGAPLRPILAAGYRDRFEPIDGEWRWVERVHLLEHIEDVSLHLWMAPPGQ